MPGFPLWVGEEVEVEEGDDGDEGEQLPPSSLHSQHAASLLCGEGVPAAEAIVIVFELLATGARAKHALVERSKRNGEEKEERGRFRPPPLRRRRRR